MHRLVHEDDPGVHRVHPPPASDAPRHSSLGNRMLLEVQGVPVIWESLGVLLPDKKRRGQLLGTRWTTGVALCTVEHPLA